MENKTLEVGAKLIKDSYNGRTIAEIDRVTRCYAYCGDVKFRRELPLKEVGFWNWTGANFKVATEEELKEVMEENRIDGMMMDIAHYPFSDEQIEEIWRKYVKVGEEQE